MSLRLILFLFLASTCMLPVRGGATAHDEGPRFTLQVTKVGAVSTLASQRDPDVVLVRETLGQQLALDAPEQVETILHQAFPGRVVALAATRLYKAVWCEEEQEFRIVCCDIQEFHVRLTSVVSVALHEESDVSD